MDKNKKIIKGMVAEIDSFAEVDDYSSLLPVKDSISVRIRKLNRTITVNIPSPMLKPIEKSKGEIMMMLKEALKAIS